MVAIVNSVFDTSNNVTDFTLTNGASAGRALAIIVHGIDSYNNASARDTSVTYDSVARTPVYNLDDFGTQKGYTSVYYIIDADLPATSGSYTIALNGFVEKWVSIVELDAAPQVTTGLTHGALQQATVYDGGSNWDSIINVTAETGSFHLITEYRPNSNTGSALPAYGATNQVAQGVNVRIVSTTDGSLDIGAAREFASQDSNIVHLNIPLVPAAVNMTPPASDQTYITGESLVRIGLDVYMQPAQSNTIISPVAAGYIPDVGGVMDDLPGVFLNPDNLPISYEITPDPDSFIVNSAGGTLIVDPINDEIESTSHPIGIYANGKHIFNYNFVVEHVEYVPVDISATIAAQAQDATGAMVGTVYYANSGDIAGQAQDATGAMQGIASTSISGDIAGQAQAATITIAAIVKAPPVLGVIAGQAQPARSFMVAGTNGNSPDVSPILGYGDYDPSIGGKFRGDEAITGTRQLTDDEYLFYIRARIASNNSTATSLEIIEQVQNLLNGSEIKVIEGNNIIQIAVGRALSTEERQVLTQSGLIAKPAGVQMVLTSQYEPNNAFGYAAFIGDTSVKGYSDGVTPSTGGKFAQSA